jgi:formylglycine-generating enzyme required for sulfatase activity
MKVCLLKTLLVEAHKKEANMMTAAMHLETLLYMLLQSDKTLPPPGVRPDFEALAARARKEAIPNEWIEVPASRITLGIDDPDNNEGPDHYFGWDNERPERHVEVGRFEAKARPITNEEYARFLRQNRKNTLPASWKSHRDTRTSQSSNAQHSLNENGIYMNGVSPPLTDAFLNGKFVKTIYGPVPLKHALDWPVFASYDELAACATWMGGRIPTAEEVCAIYDYVDAIKAKETDSILTRKISAVNGCAHTMLSMLSVL